MTLPTRLAAFLCLLIAAAATPAQTVPVIDAGATATITLPANRATLRAPAGTAATAWRVSASAGGVALSATEGAQVGLAILDPGDYVIESVSTGGSAAGIRSTRVTLRASTWAAPTGATALDHLQNSLRPVHRQGHAMAPLGGMIEHHLPMALELADHWGFGLQVAVNPGFCDVAPGAPGSYLNAALGTAVASNGRYPLIVGMANILPGYGSQSSQWVGGSTPETVWLRDLAGNRLPSANNPAMSPVAPEAWVRSVARPHGECLGRITAA